MKKVLFIFKVVITGLLLLVLSGGNLNGKVAEQCCCDMTDQDCADQAAWQCCHLNGYTTGNFFPFSHDGYCADEATCWAVISGYCELNTGGISGRVNILCECPSNVCYRPH